MSPKARNVSFNCRKIHPETALGDCAGKVAHGFYHPCIARAFKQHRVAGAQQRKQPVFQLVGRVHLQDVALRTHAFVSFGGSGKLAIAHKKQMAESAFRSLRAHLSMLAGGVGAQFAHAGKGKHLSAAARCAQRGRPQRRMHGDGIRAVTVIDNANALRRRPQLHARRSGSVLIQRSGDFFQRHAQKMRCGRSKMQIGNDLWRARFHRHTPRSLRRNTQLQQLALRAERNLPQNQPVFVANPVNRALEVLRSSIKHRFVRRKQQPTVCWNAFKELHLFLRNAFTAAECCDVGQTYIGEDAVVRPRNFFQSRHFSRGRNADLKNGQRLWLLRGKHRQRKTKLAVVASRRSEHLPARKQRFQSVFNDGFAVAAGDRQHALKIFPAMPACQRLQSAQWIGYHNQRPGVLDRRASRTVPARPGQRLRHCEKRRQESDAHPSAGLSGQQKGPREQRRASPCRCGRLFAKKR